MPSIEVFLAFLAASTLVTIAPGPDNLMVLSVGISRGRTAGIGFGLVPNGRLAALLGCALDGRAVRVDGEQRASVPLAASARSGGR